MRGEAQESTGMRNFAGCGKGSLKKAVSPEGGVSTRQSGGGDGWTACPGRGTAGTKPRSERARMCREGKISEAPERLTRGWTQTGTK